jgi:hypothetical protein
LTTEEESMLTPSPKIQPRRPARRSGARRAFATTIAVVALVLAATAGTARADQAFHVSFPISGDTVYPAGTICDFAYEQSYSGTITFTASPNGTFTQLLAIDVTHTNVDSGYTLTEHDATVSVAQPDSSGYITSGIVWHLRDASGHIVLVRAGKAVFDLNTGNLISFTPNTGLDESFAETICPLLGGSPA